MAAAGPLAGYVALGADGRALGAATMYPDRRATGQGRRVAAGRRAAGNDQGRRIPAADPVPQGRDFAARSPEMASRTHHFLDATGWLNHLLCGEPSLNVFTGLRLYAAALRQALCADYAPFGRTVYVGQDLDHPWPALAARVGLCRVAVLAGAVALPRA